MLRVAFLCAAVAVIAVLGSVNVEQPGKRMASTWAPRPSAANAFPPVWPVPKQYTNGTGKVVIASPTLRLDQTGAVQSPLLQAAFERFLPRAFPQKINSAPIPGGETTVTIDVKDVNAPVALGMDESYTLSIDDTQIVIRAQQLYGAYHGLETLSQLIQFDFDANEYNIYHAPWVITDAPRFEHRGLLIDTARHYLTVAAIKEIIQSVQYAKLNTIHWHIVDAQSFAFDSPSYPSLAEKGAFSKHERFTTDDIKGVVQFAMERGIRVEVELDTPGHSAAMCPGMPEICPDPWCPSTNVNNWALDPTKNLTYTVIGGLLKDLSALFPEKVTHLGGDEVDTYCWSLHPSIANWLGERGLTLEGGYLYYVDRVQKIAWDLGREVVGWQEIWDHFGTKLNPKTIIQQWLPNSISLPLNVTSHGYRLIWSDSSVWYLDHLSVTWDKMYEAEPCNGLPDKNCKLILGGEGCQWGETVDPSDALQTIWPRLGAIAERLWSPRSYSNATDAHDRMESFRCLLNERGVPAAPVNNLVARESPPHPGSCYRQ